MIELYFWLFVMLGCSRIAQVFYRYAHTPGYKAVFNVIAFIGVFIHETAHYTVAVLLGVKPGKFRVKFRNESGEGVAPHGSIENPEFERNSLLQSFAVGFAPMLVSTFLFMFCLDIIFNIQTQIFVKVIAVVFAGSLLIGLEPSAQDVKVVGYSFKNDPRYAVYQISLLVISGVLMWVFIDLYIFVLPFEVFYYIAYFVVLTFFYFALKGAFWIVGKSIKGIVKKMGKVQVASPKFFTRKRRFKHVKDPNEREVQW